MSPSRHGTVGIALSWWCAGVLCATLAGLAWVEQEQRHRQRTAAATRQKRWDGGLNPRAAHDILDALHRAEKES